MLDVTIRHSPPDREVAARIASRLNRGAEAMVWLEECDADAGQPVPSAGAVLLLLSPEAVPKKLRRKDWEPVLQHVEANSKPPLASVLISDCPYPKLLERKHFFRWGDDPLEALRAIERWALELHPRHDPPLLVPARLHWFQGRGEELETLWQALVDEAGVLILTNPAPRSGKTSIAQEFSRTARGHFRDILWVQCSNRSQAAILGDLGAQLGIVRRGSAGEILAHANRTLEEHRLLVVLDDLTVELPIVTSSEGRTSLLITTRHERLEVRSRVRVLRIESTPAPELAELPEDSPGRRIWQAISVCRPQGFPVELVARIAGIEERQALDACRGLAAQRWIDPFDAAGLRFRLGAGQLAATGSGAREEEFQRGHAEVVTEIFAEWRTHPARCGVFLAEWESAFEWALRSDWLLANALADRACLFLKAQDRWPEAAEIYRQLLLTAREREDLRVAGRCAWELSWIEGEGGEVRRPPPPGAQLAFDF